MTRDLRSILVGSLVLAAATAFGFAASSASPGQPAKTADDAVWERANLLFDPLPEAAPSPQNPLSEAKIALGKRLYFDPQLSEKGNVSCNSCHDLATYGVDNLPFSPGDDGELGGRNSPTVLNAALHVAQFWDGRAADVEEQAGMPVLNPVEMAIPTEEFLLERLAALPGYPEAFAAAFPDDVPALTYTHIRLALGAFERTLLTPSRFDAYLEGDRSVLDERERAGLERFMGLGCAACHNGVTVGARFFRKFGLNDSYWVHTHSKRPDEGRYLETGDPDDRYVFKVASLRNVAETAPYFHDGSVATLPEAIKIMVALQVGVDLTDEEAGEIAAFLGSLTGEVPAAALSSTEAPAGRR